MSNAKVRSRVVAAAETALERQKYVAPIEVLNAMGWASGNQIDAWRAGRIDFFTEMVSTSPDKLAAALEYLREWAIGKNLIATEASYVAATRDRRELRFVADGTADTDRIFRVHWNSPDLSEAKQEQLTAKQNKAPDLLVIMPLKDWECGTCTGTGDLLIMDGPGPLCLTCADMDHLAFLPSGDAALTRRAKKASVLSAVVVRFSRSRKRYERQGILVEEPALEAAEEQCLADEDARERRRERDRVRRVGQDVEFQAKFAAEIGRLFPGCPAPRADAIALHAGTRGSGRVGRSAAGRALGHQAITLAVIASVRHENTDYDTLLMAGVPREDARDRIRDTIDQVLDRWRQPPSAQ
ncbi:DUF2293 domain-containing protein [Fodinicola feengrottensis]|uniref:DUF2293 domain-containing protein n=1 Tax=Fodinicola feengrottensis TaxID=435914 RepID=A0ABN2J4V5_9ACTN